MKRESANFTRMLQLVTNFEFRVPIIVEFSRMTFSFFILYSDQKIWFFLKQLNCGIRIVIKYSNESKTYVGPRKHTLICDPRLNYIFLEFINKVLF